MKRLNRWQARLRRKADAGSALERLFSPRALLGYFYALAAVAWVLWVLLTGAIQLDHKMTGSMRQLTLTPDDLQFESFMNYADDEWATPPDERENWYLSTDSDPHILWQGEAFVTSVRPVALRCTTSSPASRTTVNLRRSTPIWKTEHMCLIWAVFWSAGCVLTRTVSVGYRPAWSA